MNISSEEYQIFFEMMEEEITSQVNWLKTKSEPHYKLFNAGQIKAFKHVLDLLAVHR
ncbi:hypothetical protein [Domibacillus mangrovi]|uniref:hypothetical protein n=1 Tax=Domibacillus mangrovi TaxID=1714354 RepID=UPI000A6C5DC6|nr:hypothetical protein [Domibacillus mangrovi]